MLYLGIDAGYSATVRSTGICVLAPNERTPITCRHVRTIETRKIIEELLAGRSPTAISIDGPLVPGMRPGVFTVVNRYRDCERNLSGGVFQKRCKPGPTNSPRGQLLHRQATRIASWLYTKHPNAPVYEAFPNAFLGVMLPNRAYSKPIRRGIKSDVFWEFAVRRSNIMKDLLKHLFGECGQQISSVCRQLDNHDERAAFICALTARAAHEDVSFLVDTGVDGTIALAPHTFIQPWAKAVLDERLAAVAAAN